MREKDGYRENLAILCETFPGKRMLTVSEVAKYMSCHRNTIINLIETGKLVAVNVGVGKYNVYRVPIREVARLSVR